MKSYVFRILVFDFALNHLVALTAPILPHVYSLPAGIARWLIFRSTHYSPNVFFPDDAANWGAIFSGSVTTKSSINLLSFRACQLRVTT